MAIIGSAYVEIRGIDKYLQRDIDNAMKNIKVPSLDFTSDVDLTPVRRKVKALRDEIKSNPLEFRVSADYQEVIDNLDVIKDEQAKDPLVFNVESNTDELEKALERIRNQNTDLNSTITANADTARAETQLAFTARNRKSTISMDIDPEIKRGLAGLGYTLIGAVPADKIKAGLVGVAANFEMLAIGAAKLATVIGSVSASVLTLGANLFSIAGDLTSVIGITAAMPAAFFAMGIGVTANILAWKNFGDAVTGEGKKAAEAMAKLPKEAQEAAKSLKGVGTEIRKATQTSYWKEMGTAIQSLHDSIIPQLKTGLSETGAIMGRLTKTVIQGFWEIGANGSLEAMFQNTNQGFANMQRGILPFIDALSRLGVVGSTFLPRFGTWMSDLGVQFSNFITKADEAGRINIWIENAVTTFKQLGSVVSSTVSIFNGFVAASKLSGAAGLEDFANGLRGIANAVNGEPFQSRLVFILEAARSGSDAMGEGFRKVTKFVGESTEALGEFIQTAGQISGQLLTNLTKLFDGTGLGTGLLTALWGFQDAMKELEPGFSNLGSLLGNLGEIAGTVFTSMAPGLNNLFATLDAIVANMKDGIIAAMPIFNEFTQNLMQAISGPLIAIAGIIGNLLTAFSQLPGPIQTVIATLGLLIAFRGKIDGFVSGVIGSFARMKAGVAGDLDGLSGSMRNMYGHFQAAGTHIASAGNALRNIPFATTTSGLGGLATAAGSATASIGKAAGQGLRGALSGGAALLGGPWGIALGAGIGLLAAFGQAQADAAARVDALAGSLDKQTAHITNQTKELVASSALDGATNGWDDFFRGVIQGSQSTEEALSNLGISTKDFTDKISEPSGRAGYIKALNDISNAMRDGKPVTDAMAAAIGTTKEQLAGVNGNTMRHLADEAGNTANELTKAEEKVRGIAAATGTNSVQAAILSRNYEVLASVTSSASEKFSALKQNLDIVTGGTRTLVDSQKGVAQSLDDTSAKLKAIAADTGGSLQSLYSVKDGFNFASQAGRDLHTALEGTSDSILKIGTAALDQALKGGKSAADANSIAIQAMQPAIASLRQQLADAGLMQPQIDAIIRSFGLMPDQVSTAISVEGTEEAQRKIMLTKLAADAFGNGNYKAVLAALPDDAKAAIGSAMGLGEEFKNGNYEAILSALDSTGPGKEAALAQILSVTNGNYEAALKALNLTGDPVAAATAQALGYKNQDYTAELEATNLTGGPAADATAVATAFAKGDYLAMLKALNITQGPVNDATGAAAGFSRTDFTAALKAADSTAGGRAAAAAAIAQTTGANYTAWIKAAADQGSINGVNGSLNALTATRYATIIAQYQEVGRNPGLAMAQDGFANGGILNSLGIKAFANGGFNISKFASGSENHVAQIARGAWPVRQWAEPETGGEAYIPLAASKRLRSLKILEQVAAMFGYTLFKQFAAGGILDTFTNRASTSTPISASSVVTTIPASVRGNDRPNVSLTINSNQGYTPEQLATATVSELAWQFLNR